MDIQQYKKRPLFDSIDDLQDAWRLSKTTATQRILSVLTVTKNKYVLRADLCKYSKCRKSSYSQALNELVRTGQIIRIGNGRKSSMYKYLINDTFNASLDASQSPSASNNDGGANQPTDLCEASVGSQNIEALK